MERASCAGPTWQEDLLMLIETMPPCERRSPSATAIRMPPAWPGGDDDIYAIGVVPGTRLGTNPSGRREAHGTIIRSNNHPGPFVWLVLPRVPVGWEAAPLYPYLTSDSLRKAYRTAARIEEEEMAMKQPTLPCPVCNIAIKGSWKVREHMLGDHRVRLWFRRKDTEVYLMKAACKLHPGLGWVENNFALNAGVKQSGPWYYMSMDVWEKMYGNGWATQTRRAIESGAVASGVPTGEGEDYGIGAVPTKAAEKKDIDLDNWLNDTPPPTKATDDAEEGEGGLFGSIFGDD